MTFMNVITVVPVSLKLTAGGQVRGNSMWVIKIIAVGFFTAIGWGVADAYVVQPYIVPKTRVEVEETK